MRTKFHIPGIQWFHFRMPHYRDHARHATHGVHTTLFGTEFLEGHGMVAIFAGIACILGVIAYFIHLETD